MVFSRAQKFDVLLGTPDFQAGDIDQEVPEGAIMPPLPDAIIQFLKVDLAVFRQAPAEVSDGVARGIALDPAAPSVEKLALSHVLRPASAPDARSVLPVRATAPQASGGAEDSA